MLSVSPYLSFNGTCEAAFNFYKSVFGGEFGFIGYYKDAPTDEPIPDSEKNKIMHISLPLNQHVSLMGADTSDLFGPLATFGDCTFISLSTESEEETTRIYKALSEGGKVTFPLQKTFWADLYATFTDQFGISWMLNLVHELK